MSVVQDIEKHAEAALLDLHNSNSDQALQAAIELMLVTQKPVDVLRKLQSWIYYLSEFE